MSKSLRLDDSKIEELKKRMQSLGEQSKSWNLMACKANNEAREIGKKLDLEALKRKKPMVYENFKSLFKQIVGRYKNLSQQDRQYVSQRWRTKQKNWDYFEHYVSDPIMSAFEKAVNGEIAELKRVRQQAELDKKTWEEERKKAQGEADKIKEDNKTLEIKVNQLQQDKKALETKVAELQKHVQDMNDKNQELKVMISLNARINLLEEEKERTEEREKNIETKARQMQRAIDEMREENKKLHTLISFSCKRGVKYSGKSLGEQ